MGYSRLSVPMKLWKSYSYKHGLGFVIRIAILVLLWWIFWRVPEKLRTPNCQIADSELKAYLVNPTGPAALPDLKNVGWPIREYAPKSFVTSNGNKSIPYVAPPFEPVLTEAMHAVLMKLLHHFADVMEENGFGDRYFLEGGALIGSYRHHGLIPWDDDIDILVDVMIRDKVREMLVSEDRRFDLYTWTSRDKFFMKPLPENSTGTVVGGHMVNDWPWAWPYLDIGYYIQSATHVRAPAGEKKQLVWILSTIFPLLYRPFDNRWLPTPRRTLLMLQSYYGNIFELHSLRYSHIMEKTLTTAKLRQKNVAHRYGFVQRSWTTIYLHNENCSVSLIPEDLVKIDEHNNATSFHSLLVVVDSINE